MISRGSWVLIPSGSAHGLILSLSLFMGNGCKGFLGPHTLGFCARPLLSLSLASWGMVARGPWVLIPSGSAHDPYSFSPLLPGVFFHRGRGPSYPPCLRTTSLLLFLSSSATLAPSH